MTCIVGIEYDGNVYIGGDSAGVGGYRMTQRKDRKVFRNGDFLMGFTTSFRMGQLLAHKLNPPLRHPSDDVYKYMVTSFVDAVRVCLRDGGFAKANNGEETAGTFLVGYEGRLFYVYDDYQVGEPIDGFAACGCGEDIALGVLSVTSHLPPLDRVRLALEASERFSAGVRRPFHIETLSEPQGQAATSKGTE